MPQRDQNKEPISGASQEQHPGRSNKISQGDAASLALIRRVLEYGAWESEIEAIYATAPVGLGLIDKDFRFLRVNQALADMNGLAVVEHLGKSIREVVPDAASVLEPLLREVIASARPVLDRELKATTAAGGEGYFLVSYFPLKSADGRVLAVNGVVQDISERKRQEAQLQEAYGRLETRVSGRTAELSAANQKLQTEIAQRIQAQAALEAQAAKLREQAELLDLANDAIFIRKLDGTICYWNEGAERLYGWTGKEVMHQSLSHFLKTEYPLPWAEIQQSLLRDRKWEGELVHTRRDGSKVTVASRWTLWRDEFGKAQGWLQINSDISERKRAEELLRMLSARLLQTQDEERRRIARELHDSAGQLLVGLDINLVTVQREAKKLTANAGHALSESIGLVKELSAELRNISHLLHPPLLDEAGLPAAIRWYVERYSQRSKISVQLDLPDSLGRLPREIETTIFRIVQESLTNVHRHSGSSTAAIRLTREFGQVKVEVCDEGKGLEAENYRTFSGVVTPGVGIQGMRERVRQLGGRFDIRSGETGTTVVATLPLDDAEAKTAD
jgi:PAS domain S-box-containing protein